jgi:UDP-glucose 4-epimerase
VQLVALLGGRRQRFLFASSCSLYGVAGDDLVTETAAFHPVTPYGESKVLVERDVARLADASFRVFLGTRPPTVCPRLG